MHSRLSTVHCPQCLGSRTDVWKNYWHCQCQGLLVHRIFFLRSLQYSIMYWEREIIVVGNVHRTVMYCKRERKSKYRNISQYKSTVANTVKQKMLCFGSTFVSDPDPWPALEKQCGSRSISNLIFLSWSKSDEKIFHKKLFIIEYIPWICL